MTQIVAGVFDDEQAASVAARGLRNTGFDAADLDQFSLRPPGQHQGLATGGDETADPQAKGGDAGAVKGAAIGTAVGAVAGLAAAPLLGPIAVAGGAAAGAYAGSLAGAVEWMGNDKRVSPQPRPAGVMVAVHAESSDDRTRAVGVMRGHGARMIERADGTWRNGKWADCDPVGAPDVIESHVDGSPQHEASARGAR
jgi:hypothetical protein